MADSPVRHSSSLNRRQLLERLGLGAAAITAGACKPQPAEPTPPGRTPRPDTLWNGSVEADVTAFPLGVQTGAPKADSLLFWTRYVGADPLELHVMTYDGGEWVEHSRAPVEVGAEGYVHHTLSNLSPDTPLAYQFIDANGIGSSVGHGRTAIDTDSTAVVRFGATSCTSKNHIDFPSLNNLVNRYEMDFFAWLGDTVYADDAETSEEYRSFYEYNINSDGFVAVMGNTPGIFSWDDHEVANNWSIESIDPERFDIASTAFFENLAIERLPETPNRLWRSFTFGKTVEVFVLDCRGEREPSKGIYLSVEQMDWLKQGLSSSKAVWKIILNSIPITEMPAIYQFPEMLDDRWEGFPEQREELLDHIVDEGIDGVLFVSGDLHQCSLSRIEASGPRSSILEVCAGPSGPNFLGTPARFFEDGEQWLWSDADFCATYLSCSASGTCTLVTVDERDNTLFEGIIDTQGNLLTSEIFHPWEQPQE